MYFILCVISFVLIIYIRRKYFLYALLNHGQVTYIDEAGSKSIVNYKYGVIAKPDRVAVYKGKKYVIEFKSRKKGVYHKDMVQALVGALACYDDDVRPEYALVYNSSHEYKVVRFRNEKVLYKKIRKLIAKTRKIKDEKAVPLFFKKGKCKACIYSKACKKSG